MNTERSVGKSVLLKKRQESLLLRPGLPCGSDSLKYSVFTELFGKLPYLDCKSYSVGKKHAWINNAR